MTQLVTIQRRYERPLFRWLLPLWFAVGALLALQWPGDNHRLFSIGALPGVWVAFLASAHDTAMSWLLPTLGGGLPILFGFGYMLDRLGTDARLWFGAMLVAAAASGYFLLSSHDDLLASVVCALQLGSYGATLLLFIVGAGRGTRA